MTHLIDYSPADMLLAKLAIRDMGLKRADLDVLQALADMPGSNAQDFQKHILRKYPDWRGRSNALPEIFDALKRGLDLDD